MLSRTATDVIFRSAGAPLVGGNYVRILCDAEENYPAWTAAVERARRTIHLEMYIVHNDGVGREARDLLVARSRAGVTVRVLYDWFGSLRLSSRGFWRPLVEAGGEVRVANPPRVDSLLGLLSRDHRKLLAVDGEVAFHLRALHRRRVDGRSGARRLALAFLALGVFLVWFPRVLVYPVVAVLLWEAIALVVKAARLRFGRAGDSGAGPRPPS